MFADAESLTAGLIVGSPALMVHHVDPGSDAETAGVMHYDLVVTADRAPVASLDALLQHARQAQARHQPLELMLLRIGNDTSDDLFVYERRLLPVEEIAPIGP